jgi:methyl-accepting chemotaxis protein
MKIGAKLVGVIGFIFIFVTALMLSGAMVRMDLVRKIDSMYKQYVLDVKVTGSMNASINKMDGYLYHLVAVPSARGALSENILQEIDLMEKNLQIFKGKKLDAEERTLLSDLESTWPDVQRGYMEAIKLAADGKYDEVNRLLSENNSFSEARKKTSEAAFGLSSYNNSLNETSIKKVVTGKGGFSGFLWLFSGVGALMLVLMAVALTRSLAKPLKKIVLMMREIEKGHLSSRLNMNRNDEIGELSQSMDNFVSHLQNNVISNVQKIAEGDININTTIIDENDEIGPNFKRMVEHMNILGQEVTDLTMAAQQGKLDVRGNKDNLKGTFRHLIHAINTTLDSMIGPINEASNVLVQIANKDMTARIKGDYKGDHAIIKESLNMAVENLDKVLQHVAISADQVASASVQISTGGQSLSQGASEQASSLEEVSSSLQEMSSMTKQSALNAREAKGVADAARDSADKGVESMNRMSSAINKIKTSSDATAKIVKTIDEIAFQTNLLALNAAVEAARAGDAGRGFAVVAEEVRNLAMRSAEAAKNTANLIEEAVRNSENGVSINSEVLKNFQDITEKINKVSQVVAEIAAASEQQDQGISQVNRAVEQLNQVTQQNAANAEESASAAEEMSSQSEEMRSMIAAFQLTSSNDAALTGSGFESDGNSYETQKGKTGRNLISGPQS